MPRGEAALVGEVQHEAVILDVEVHAEARTEGRPTEGRPTLLLHADRAHGAAHDLTAAGRACMLDRMQADHRGGATHDLHRRMLSDMREHGAVVDKHGRVLKQKATPTSSGGLDLEGDDGGDDGGDD